LPWRRTGRCAAPQERRASDDRLTMWRTGRSKATPRVPAGRSLPAVGAPAGLSEAPATPAPATPTPTPPTPAPAPSEAEAQAGAVTEGARVPHGGGRIRRLHASSSVRRCHSPGGPTSGQ